MSDEPVDCPNCDSTEIVCEWEKLNGVQTLRCHCEHCGYTWIAEEKET